MVKEYSLKPHLFFYINIFFVCFAEKKSKHGVRVKGQLVDLSNRPETAKIIPPSRAAPLLAR